MVQEEELKVKFSDGTSLEYSDTRIRTNVTDGVLRIYEIIDGWEEDTLVEMYAPGYWLGVIYDS